jgi:hypothetical protein
VIESEEITEQTQLTEPKRGRPSKAKTQSNNYINNKEFQAILVEYRTNPSRKLYNKLGEIVLMLAKRYILKPKFVKYSKDRQNEMISNACLIMITTCIKDYDFVKYSNPFAYFTQSCNNSFLQHINAEKLRESRYSNVSFIDNLENVGADE